jgi:hypothetical protein
MVPALHVKQLLYPAREYLPGIHDVHVGAFMTENFPALHSEQEVAPLLSAYLPGPHDKQLILSVEYCPGLQAVQFDARAIDTIPILQLLQAVIPALGVKLPAGQSVQALDCGNEY